MRIKKNRTFDALYISDIHYLIDRKIKRHSHKDFFAALKYLHKKGVRFRKIYLVGDIIENWYFSASARLKKRQKRLCKFFNKIEKLTFLNGEKFFIIGNHDTVNYDQSLPAMIHDFLEERNWNIMQKYENDFIVVVHGHQGQYGKLSWFWSIFIVRILYRIARMNPKFWHYLENLYKNRINYDWHNTIEESIHYYERLSKKVKQNNRILITGHTHQFVFLEDYKTINTGDWVESKTMVFQKGKNFSGYSYDKKSKLPFKKKFTFKAK